MTEPYEGWAIVELMGHRKLAGRVCQAEQFGTVMLRIDVPRKDGSESTHFYSGPSLFGVHPTTEEVARPIGESCEPSPVQRWELPALAARTGELVDCEYDDGNDIEYDDTLTSEPPEANCTCGYGDSEEMTKHAPLCGLSEDQTAANEEVLRSEAEATVDNDCADEPSAGQTMIFDKPPEIAAWPSQGVVPPDPEAEPMTRESKTCCEPGKVCDECTPF